MAVFQVCMQPVLELRRGLMARARRPDLPARTAIALLVLVAVAVAARLLQQVPLVELVELVEHKVAGAVEAVVE